MHDPRLHDAIKTRMAATCLRELAEENSVPAQILCQIRAILRYLDGEEPQRFRVHG